MNHFFDVLTKIEKIIASFAILLLTLLVVFDILGRELFSLSIPWAQKSAVYLMIWAGFIGAALNSESASHLRPEIADKLWGEKGKLLFTRLQNLTIAAFSFTLCYFSISYVQETFEFGDTNVIINIKMWVLQLILPYTFLSVGLRHFRFVLDPQLALDRKAQEQIK